MEISKSTPYVRYRENISSTLHKGTIHIESEYLDRERKTTIESIEGQTWQNMVNGENKEEDILPRLGLKIEGNEDVFDTVEQHMSIDTIIGDVQPVANEDGTYTYEISTMEGSYAKTLEGENNFSLTSDGLVGDMYIKYNAQGEEVNGNIVMDNWQSSHTIENSNNGEIKSAILTGQTLVNMTKQQEKEIVFNQRYQKYAIANDIQPGELIHGEHIYMSMEVNIHELNIETPLFQCMSARDLAGYIHIVKSFDEIKNIPKNTWVRISTIRLVNKNESLDNYSLQFGLEGDHPTTEGEQIARVSFRNPIWINLTKIYGNGNEPTLTECDNIPYFEGMQSVKMPVVTTTGKNLFDINIFKNQADGYIFPYDVWKLQLKPNTIYMVNSTFTKPNGDTSIYDSYGAIINGSEKINYIYHWDSNGHYVNKAFTTDNTGVIYLGWYNRGDCPYDIWDIVDMQIEEGSVATSYEPFKSNILTTPSDVTLRKVGDVQDELDLTTGKLTQRIGEVVLDGSEDWKNQDDSKWNNDTHISFRFKLNNMAYNRWNSRTINCISDKFTTKPLNNNSYILAEEFIGSDGLAIGDMNFNIKLLRSRLNGDETLDGFKEWLSQNPFTLQYQLATPTIKTVDLTIKDQDDKIIQSLHTHPSTTHINLSSDGLIPSAEINYTMYGNIGETTGEQITDGVDSKLIEGKVYGDTLLNVLPSPSLKNSMDDISMQKLNNGYDNVNVVDGEFKGAILQGNTLVNIATKHEGGSDGGGEVLMTPTLLKANTKYYIKVIDNEFALSRASFRTKDWTDRWYHATNGVAILTTPSQDEFNNYMYLTFKVTKNGEQVEIDNTIRDRLKWIICEYQEGMENQDIPYFEGMQSVKTPSLMTVGKNLFNKNNIIVDGYIISNGTLAYQTGDNRNATDYIEVESNCSYTISGIKNSAINGAKSHQYIGMYDKNKTYISTATIYCLGDKETITTAENTKYIRLSVRNDDINRLQIEKGTTATSYEPHQSNTLTTPEDITLRAIGDVRDELDCVTGEVTERIGEIVLDGSQDGEYNHTYDESLGILTIRLPKIPDIKNDGSNLYGLLSNKYNSVTNKSPNNIMAYNGRIMITKPISELESFSTSDKIKSFLSQNPITIQYPLQTPITETINPTITNQDNQPQTALHSIANGYISTSSQGSLPKVTYEVPTSNSYYLDTMVKTDTQYTTKSSSDCNATIDGTSYPLSANGTFTTPSTITDKMMILDTPVNDLMFIEGDLTGRELDYFTGLQSVESPLAIVYGKNLLIPEMLKLGSSFDGTDTSNNYRHSIFIPIEPDTKYCFRYIDHVYWYDNTKKQIGDKIPAWGTEYRIFTSPSNTKYVRVTINSGEFPGEHKNQPSWFLCSIIKSDVNIYEPCQSSILTTNEPIALHKIGDVKDELDLVNECVVRQIGEIVLDGSEDWIASGNNSTLSNINYIQFYYSHSYSILKNKRSMFMCDKLPTKPISEWMTSWNDTSLAESFIVLSTTNELCIRIPTSYINSQDVDGFKQWLSKNPITVIYELETPTTTEPIRLVPQNPKQSTTSLTLQSPLQKVGNVADQLRWNPYKGHYVRYNYIQDGVANSTYTFEDLKDMNERKFVNLYNQRTYIDTDHTVQVISHGLSRYCLAEQGKQYQVRWDWVEQSSVDTIKVDLCGNVKEIPSSDNSVIIDVEKFTHQFIQIQGLGLTGKITNLMVIETIDGEIPDVDFFSGIQCVGNTVTIDGNTKVQIDMEQTNGNLIDVDYMIDNNGNNVAITDNPLIRPNKKYILKTKSGNTGGSHCYVSDKNKNRLFSIGLGANEITEVNIPYNGYYFRFHKSVTSNGSVNKFYPFELCYADMAKDGIRPRYYDKESIILPMKLCRVGNIYDNLYYDDLKGYYRIQQSIGHKYFTGETTEVWTMETTNGYRTIKFTCTSANIDQIAMGSTICNSFRHLSTINEDMEGFIIYNGNFVLRVDKDRLADKTVDGFKALLASNPIHLFYQLKTPQMINLTEYPNRIEFNTYRDEIFTFFKGMNPTKFTLSVPMDKTYRYEIAEEGQGLANRVTVNNETISAENVVAVKEIRGQGIANIIEDVDNIVITPRPNHGAVATSHTLNNTKPATIRVHGFEPSGETAIGTYNVTDKAYQLKVMSSNGDNSLSDYHVLNVPYKLETYADGTKDMVYYDEAYKQWHFKGLSVKNYTAASDGMLNETVEVFRGLAPRSGMIVEFKLRFTSGTTTARFSYSTNGVTYNSLSLRGMSDGNYLYVAFFNTGGTKIDMARKTDPNAEYELLSFLTQVPECLMVNQIQNCEFCEVTINKQYIYSEMKSPIELDTYDGTTKVFMDGNATDTNIIIRNDATTKIVNTYTDTEYTVYWKYVDGLGNLRITLGGTTVEVDGKQEYATIKTQLNAPQELLYVGGYNLSIKDLMVVKGAKIDDLPYFEGSRQVGTLVLDEEGNKSYKITLVQGGSVLEQRDEDAIAFKDDNKHNVVVHKIVGICPTKVD